MANTIKKEYDVFIAYHGTYEADGSKTTADKLYDYLTSKGLKCFYYPKTGGDAYKANIIEVLKSRTFLLVASNTIHTLPNKKIDNTSHLELWCEINTFYAMVQRKLASLSDAKIYACGDWRKGDEAYLHELFDHRKHIYDDPNGDSMLETYNWIKEQTKNANTWANKQKSNEITEVLTTKASLKSAIDLANEIAKAKVVKSIGISINELTINANLDAEAECINNGGTIELLFLDPDGKNTEVRQEEEETLPPHFIQGQTKNNMAWALHFKNQLGDKKENFKMYTYDMIPRMNMIFIDDMLVLQYYANNVSGLHNPALIIKKTGSSPIFNYCLKVYEYIKSKSKPFTGEPNETH